MERSSLFRPFEEVRVPLKLLVYGDPGTEKTRRALKMPRPVYVIDMENGASSYADLIEPGQGFYLATKSHAELSEALEELLAMPSGDVGTLVIDPITVVWDSIKAGHIERIVRKKRCAPEDVFFDVGTWGKLKRTYGDLMTRILNAPFHVVMTARGKEKIDERGNKLGYGYDGEKTTTFLANVVIESHADYDIVWKDRTGTFKESSRRPRVSFKDFLPQTGRGVSHLETDSEAAEKDAYEQDWRQFGQTVREMGLTVDVVTQWCISKGWKRPVTANPGERRRLLQILGSDTARAEIADFSGEPPPLQFRRDPLKPTDKAPAFAPAQSDVAGV
ncbi:MAG: AAA family ATPase [Myxococcota bacterium]